MKVCLLPVARGVLQEIRLDPYNQKFIMWTDQRESGSIYTFRSQFSQTVYRDLIFFDVEDAGFESSKGLKLNTKGGEVTKMYGMPFNVHYSYNTYQYLYPSQSMIVSISYSTNTVTGIMYYGIKK